MNISQAKEYIKNSIYLYLKKDALGQYRIPTENQRPIFLLGAPGIGKTAIMQQIAQEMGIALVSYSMTHHTRQSALGLPFIVEKEYQGQKFTVSEYTMSEIIASIYETMEKSGIDQGILFLDEINCVSETLSPSMLQFLQYKTFGQHRVPEGWIVVTAGNPPQYNRSVREFDVVTLDRLKILEVEEDYGAWKDYAMQKGIHPAILSFLETNKEYFYHIETTAKGRLYVTARGWEDLSTILCLYEEEGLAVDETLIGQYVRAEKITREFSAYYDLYQKYKKDYQPEKILSFHFDDDICDRLKAAPFDERLAFVGMLSAALMSRMTEVMENIEFITRVQGYLLPLKEEGEDKLRERLQSLVTEESEQREKKEAAGALSTRERRRSLRIVNFLEEAIRRWDGFSGVKDLFDRAVADLIDQRGQEVETQFESALSFMDQVFSQGNEMLVFVTELTANNDAASFIAQFGMGAFLAYTDKLMLSDRQAFLMGRVRILSKSGN
ncbi:MAG: AAA family ATPase [Lachnospiraceae bacterium]|nr:AAA family ATPase [Lachnospiraceae bacterium]